MLFLLFYVGSERYVCDSQHILEVVPNVQLKQLPHTPPYIAGLLNLGGMPIPVIDFCQLIEGRPARLSMHTRIMILSDNRVDNHPRILGIRGEKITETLDRELADFIDPGVLVEDLPFLAGILSDPEGMIRLIDVAKLFNSMEPVLFCKEL